MLQRLSFHKKLFYIVSLFFLCAALCASVIFYIYIYRINLQEIEKFYMQTNQTIKTDIDYMLAGMEKLTTQLAANETVQKVFQAAQGPAHEDALYFDYNLEHKSLLQRECIALNTPIDNKGIINIYKQPNIFFSNNIGKENPGHVKEQLQSCFEFNEKDRAGVKYIFTGPRHDKWELSEENELFISILRPLVSTYSGGNIVGTIEMSERYEKVTDVCRMAEVVRDMEIIIIDSETAELIYPYEAYDRQAAEFYLSFKGLDQNVIDKVELPGGKKVMLNVQKSERSNWIFFGVQPHIVYMQPLMNLSFLIFSVVVIFVLTMMLVIFFVTNKLTIPVRDLKQAVRSVTIEDVGIHMDNSTNNEIASLQQAFADILNKLQTSANELTLSQSTQYEAKIMALQAQINPHFLYNSLMAISAAGMENGNRKVEAMCSQLGRLFRYAANENQKSTIAAEMGNITTYLEFMKWRYLDTVEFYIDVEEGIYAIEVPKLILQPIIENCFVYAFHSILPPLQIKVRGTCESGFWKIKISDNGRGISREDMETLQNLKSGIESAISHKKNGQHLDIGGKALINIFARLYLIYGAETIFELKNIEGGGFCVVIGGTIP